MKKRLLSYLLCITSISLYSQSADLQLFNPMLRVGDNLSINYEINPPKTDISNKIIDISDSIKNIKSKPPIKSCKSPDFSIARGSFSLSNNFDTIGNHTIGPFSFNIDGVIYESNTITVNVYPELPKVANGLWINLIKYEDDYYIILEQRIEGKIDIPFIPQIRENDSTYVKLDESYFKSDGDIVILQSSSTVRNKSLENDMENKESLYSEKKTIYKIWFSDDYDNSFTLTKKYLKHLPKNIDYKHLMIKI